MVDVGDETRCREWTLTDAYCLPVNQILASNHRLPNFSGLLWLWGCLGLTGAESVMVIGDNKRDQLLVAGLLYLSGQSKVFILDSRSDGWKEAGETLSAGRIRPTTRTAVYTRSMRTHELLLPNELAGQLATDGAREILDGRSEAEYWAEQVRGHRGGHLPGAISSPLTDWQNDVQGDFQQSLLLPEQPVVYGHNSVDSVVYYALLQSRGIPATALLGGWQSWASNAQLPLDAETFVDDAQTVIRSASIKSQYNPEYNTMLKLLVGALIVINGILAGVIIHQRRRA